MKIAADGDAGRDSQCTNAREKTSAPAFPAGQTASRSGNVDHTEKRASSLQSSTRGENPPAHSSSSAFAAVSSLSERRQHGHTGKGIDLDLRHAVHDAQCTCFRVQRTDLSAMAARLPSLRKACRVAPAASAAMPARETPCAYRQAYSSSRTCPASTGYASSLRVAPSAAACAKEPHSSEASAA